MIGLPCSEEIVITFGMERLEWCENKFNRFDRIHERDRETDGHRTTA